MKRSGYLMRMLRRLIGVLVLGVVVLALVCVQVQVVSANPDSQSWHLLSTDYTGMKANNEPHYKDIFMNKTGNAEGQSAYFNSSKEVWWYAENAAECDLSFGNNDWTAYIYHGPVHGTAGASVKFFTDVYKVNDTNGNTIHLAGGNTTIADGTASGVTVINCADDGNTEQSFTSNDRLAFRINHNSSENNRIYYYNYSENGKFSNLTSPSSDPGYPVPELSTLILLSTGLIALAGYVLLTKRRN
jgi:Tfp pilus assembly protein PilV